MSAILTAVQIRRAYAGSLELHIDELAIERGQVLGLLGPSGAGKSTLLRILALLERPDSGKVRVDGKLSGPRSLQTRRRMASALQSQVLWRDSVIQNVEFGLRVRGIGRRERRARAEQALSEVRLTGLEDRSVSEISGGQAQRVILARALAVEPEILFLDEPLAHIDEPLRELLAVDLRKFTQRTGCATAWVTHDRSEALAISDDLALIDEGKLLQWGPAMEVFAQPAGERAGRLVGADNILAGVIASNDEGIACIDIHTETFETMSPLPAGTEVFLLVRPEDVSVWAAPPGGSSPRNRLEGRITEVVSLGALKKLRVQASAPMVALITRPTFDELDLSVGKKVWLGFKAAAAHVVRRT